MHNKTTSFHILIYAKLKGKFVLNIDLLGVNQGIIYSKTWKWTKTGTKSFKALKTSLNKTNAVNK